MLQWLNLEVCLYWTTNDYDYIYFLNLNLVKTAFDSPFTLMTLLSQSLRSVIQDLHSFIPFTPWSNLNQSPSLLCLHFLHPRSCMPSKSRVNHRYAIPELATTYIPSSFSLVNSELVSFHSFAYISSIIRFGHLEEGSVGSLLELLLITARKHPLSYCEGVALFLFPLLLLHRKGQREN